MTEKLKASGKTIAEALQEVADKLSLTIQDLDYEVTREQFFTEDGQPCGVDTLELKAWEKEKVDTTEIETTRDWLQKLLDLMNIEATVTFVITRNNKVELRVKSEQGGRIVGRKGSTLKNIRTVMNAQIDEETNIWNYSIEVDGGERKEDSRRDGGQRRDRFSKTSKRDQDKLKQLAKKLARKVLNSQEELVINREMSSFERRIVHITIQSIDGVTTESFMDGQNKKIKIILDTVVEE